MEEVAKSLKGLCAFLGAVLLTLGIAGAVILPLAGGGAILLAELSGPSARPHCAYRTGNRSCPKPATTVKAIRTKAALDATATGFCRKFPEMCESLRPADRKTVEDVVNYQGERVINLRFCEVGNRCGATGDNGR